MKIVAINQIIDIFERGKARLIIASRVFNKGVSIKRIDTIVSVAETEDANNRTDGLGVRP